MRQDFHADCKSSRLENVSILDQFDRKSSNVT